jgi:hypothetical protein
MTKHQGMYFPKWLVKLLDKTYDEPKFPHRNLFDHTRHIGNVAYAHPYGADDCDFETLIAYCKQHGLRFSVRGQSDYHSNAFTVVIWRHKDGSEYGQLNGKKNG